ncbi:MAG: hypothetical protein ACREV7_16845 [Steroidobacteraceae bacterium]
MLKRLQYWTLLGVGAACLALAITNMALFTANRAVQSEVSARNQYIQQSGSLQGLYQSMVRALADLSVRNKDDALRAVLTRQGITVTAKPTPPASAAPAAAPAKPVAPQRSRGKHHG